MTHHHKIDCWIFTGGLSPDARIIQYYLSQSPHGCIIAADSGVDTASAMGLAIDYAIGDFDSIQSKDSLKTIDPQCVFSYPTDKDYSDTELALQLAYKLNYRSIGLIGGGGGRSDHFLSLLQMFHRPYAPVLWLTPCEAMQIVQNECQIAGKVQGQISFYPLIPPKKVTSQGLVWELDQVAWHTADMSLSNRFRQDIVYLQCDGGMLLAISSHA
jgi:thiamine pyrophosphokinase